MRIIRVKNRWEMSEKAAQVIIEKVKTHPFAVLGLATGGTPKGTYVNLIENHQKEGTSYAGVRTVNLDEYVGLPPDHKNSYHHFMNKHLFRGLDLPEEQIFLPNGMADDLDAECRRYDALIDALGGIDLQLLGIGKNGHIGFNEPDTSFQTKTHVVELTHSTRKANARFFENINEVPTHAITMGIASILASKEILLLASGKNKAEAMRRLWEEDVNEAFPASALKMHEHVIVIADEDALSLVDRDRHSRAR
ncbi:MAG TPA: glucosamine-6-phosphate deaminase [Bacillales bacterium]|nr:glucosamine-6-phosphate deaminase [Bacillales bacterium]